MESETVILELKDLYKSFEHTKVIRGINLKVKKGEFITLLGASGCGKTTTLRMIAGLEEPDKGDILLENQVVTHLEPNKRDVNMVFQNYALFPHMDVEGNIGYGLKIRKVPKTKIRDRVKEALRQVQLEGFEKRKISQLSGGQKQRVAIARSIVNNPKILLLDEPLGALDLKLRREMQIELKNLQREIGITFVYITHDQEEAASMSDRIVVMHCGNIEQIGTPKEIASEPKTPYVAEFIRSERFHTL
ncbi:ATP-binding cassette domain-containing protein [bacterium 1XD42-8]|jgi:spermidine/putrescine transport system ATP-binding protein|nr:ATP-binding cassette domain-containing protein [Lachnospiraceae bacterium]RKJ49925.1 ATP-binding cassette domain-containing protein [bacterium 1XD42-8]